MTLLLAAGRTVITPGSGHPMGGYLSREGVATGVHDDLEATLVWLSSQDDPGVVWVTLDALATDVSLTRALATVVAQETGVPANRVLVCASHTHSGPDGWTGAIHPGMPAQREPELVERLIEQVGAVACGIRPHRTPVSARWHEGAAARVGANRNRQDGPHDGSVGVLTLHHPDGTVAALLFDYASHPTVLGADNLDWSADWPGATRRELAGLAPVVAFLQGAAGDASSRFVRQGRGHAEVSALGGRLAESITGLLSSGQPVEEPIRLTRTVLRLPHRALPSPAECRQLREGAERGWRKMLPGKENDPAVRIAQTRYEGTLMLSTLAAAGLPGEAEVPVTVVSLGEVAWLHTPFELFSSIALRIRAASPFAHTRVIGYTDGYAGYLPDHDAYREGLYESYIALVEQGAADVLVDRCAELLRAHRDRRAVVNTV
ncbi:hypothetical protein SK854_23005 [Lentzea sp. BCCO 10_0061]|uniref:Neutral/alkaline non-lysosomal ceramidase N-terminal domain-containing protein n=1 Tax=Lentzea sokolovensis TaxID=3095429 RepID=A0ABU4UZP5_9PSEU|nr:hypothetical protein [Lentzea sp. BCCO 10_0061]MDX8144998.1 hypothetical protein [Lentzea sp. BCCO 10_0061]